jgi:hypothetical protein
MWPWSFFDHPKGGRPALRDGRYKIKNKVKNEIKNARLIKAGGRYRFKSEFKNNSKTKRLRDASAT